jgi:hypothetical protein
MFSNPNRLTARFTGARQAGRARKGSPLRASMARCRRVLCHCELQLADGIHIFVPTHPTVPPLSASCSSGQRFAYSFLRIRSRPRHPCRSANTSPCRVCEGLSPPSRCALPGAPRKRRGLRNRSPRLERTTSARLRFADQARFLRGIAPMANNPSPSNASVPGSGTTFTRPRVLRVPCKHQSPGCGDPV